MANIKYAPKDIEEKWQKVWEEKELNKATENSSKPKQYVMEMLPYPSGANLHVGHMLGYVAVDVYARYSRMLGFNVMRPVGWDSFGLPAENYAIKTQTLPQVSTEAAITASREQLQRTGMSYDWSRETNTSDPAYYKWTQWLFIEFFKKGLVYKKKASVNWCPKDQTVLANEQVINGRCERCDTEVVQKELEQWFMAITKYADALLDGLTQIDWPMSTKAAQCNWIGRKEGIEITYKVKNTDESVTVFTTRPDTNLGATFVAVAPENPILKKITTLEQRAAVDAYLAEAKNKTEVERAQENKDKTGVFTGAYAINPLNDYKMPIWVSDFVLAGFGTGALVGVPGHDLRDFDFARKFNLPVKIVVAAPFTPRSYLMGAENITDEELVANGVIIKATLDSGSRKLEIPDIAFDAYKALIIDKLTPGYWNEVVGKDVWFLFKDKDGNIEEFTLNDGNKDTIAAKCSAFNGDPIEKTSNMWLYLAENEWYGEVLIQEEYGTMVNSGFLDGMNIHDATKKMMDYIEKEGYGKRVTTYHLRDWLISRQRYWGAPIPMIYCDKDGWSPVPEDQLPVLLPTDVDFQPTGESPITRSKTFQDGVRCPICGGPGRREVDTMDTFVDSSWYFLRYCDSHNTTAPFAKDKVDYWMPVDLYIGGDHATTHLIFARFFMMALKDMGLVSQSEPFAHFFKNGHILGEDNRKMSKRWGNVINPLDIINKYGADTLRMYEMFMGPLEDTKAWNMSGIEGMERFLKRVWHLLSYQEYSSEELSAESLYMMHTTIERATNDIQHLRFNTAIAGLMEWYNFLSARKSLHQDEAKTFILLLAPFAPHMTEELWQTQFPQAQNDRFESIHQQSWPVSDKTHLDRQDVTIIVQVNGKLRGNMVMDKNQASNQAEVERIVRTNEKIAHWLTTGAVKHIIFVPGKIINFVVA